jgi:DNA-binding NtrC family response regulator
MVDKKWNILVIEDDRSQFDFNTPVLIRLFNRVDRVSGREEALVSFHANSYDMVISDLSVEPEELAFLKQLKDLKPKQEIFALVTPQDTDKLYGIADLGINAFELTSEQLDQALEQIALFDPYEEREQ